MSVSKNQIVSLPSEGRSLALGGLGVIYKVLPEDTSGALAVVEHPMEPRRLVRPHIHAREDEISYIIEGEIGVKIGEREIAAGPGTWVFKPRGVQHTFWNAGPKPARLIEIITPGGFVYYFEELAAILRSGGPPDERKIEQINRKYEVTYNLEWVPDLMVKYRLEKLVGEP
jgi:mannose-6-phosphate isomerase-like protein (cupin superfamily)